MDVKVSKTYVYGTASVMLNDLVVGVVRAAPNDPTLSPGLVLLL